MISQQLYRVNASGGRTIAVSDELRGSAWLNLLEEQLSLIDYSALSAPVYYQYPLGRGIVMSRCSVNPYTPEQSFIAHQLVLDDMADIDALLSMRPMKSELLPAGIFGYTETPVSLPALAPSELCSPEEAVRCREALKGLFQNDSELLARFFSAVSLCARDKRHFVRVAVGAAPEAVTEIGRQVMELTLCALPREDVLRLSFASLCACAPSAMQFTVCFAPKSSLPAAAESSELRIDMEEGDVFLPEGVELPRIELFIEKAKALLTGDAPSAVRPARTVGVKLPPFEEGMSIRQYFADWRAAMEHKKSALTDEGFRALAAAEWPNLLGVMITASDRMDNLRFLTEFSGIISQIRREKLESTLSMSDNTLTDLLIILLDSVSWRQIDLSRPQTARLLKSICAYTQVLGEEQCPAECLCAGRVIYCALVSPGSIHAALNDLSRLEAASVSQFDSVQDCLQQYVEKRLTSEMDVIDESLAAAAMLGFARFSDGIPDLRLADKLTERIAEKNGSKAARRFEQQLDKLRRHLHSAPAGLMRRRDMKLFLFISLLLLLLIIAITVGFMLLN